MRILSRVDFATSRNNLFIVAISVGAGMIPLVAPTFFSQLPKALDPILSSGIVLASITAVLLNACFNGTGSAEVAGAAAADVAKAAEHA